MEATNSTPYFWVTACRPGQSPWAATASTGWTEVAVQATDLDAALARVRAETALEPSRVAKGYRIDPYQTRFANRVLEG